MMELSISDIRELLADKAEPSDNGGFEIDQKVFIRTITHYYVGLVDTITPSMIGLTTASWVADTGLFSEMLMEGTINELEPFVDRVYVSRGSIVDHTLWNHQLPRERK